MSRAKKIRGPLLAIVALGGFAALFLQNTTSLVGSDSAPPLPGWALVKIERAVETALEKEGIPGLSIALSYQGRQWSAGFGLADVEQHVPVTPETVFRFASISKPITAVAVMKLVESGQIDLDAPVNRYLPHYPRKRWPVTCKNLLTHQAGIRHYRGHELESTRHYTALPDTLAIFQNDPLEFEPASKYLYSTYGFNLLGGCRRSSHRARLRLLPQKRCLRTRRHDQHPRRRRRSPHPPPRGRLPQGARRRRSNARPWPISATRSPAAASAAPPLTSSPSPKPSTRVPSSALIPSNS